MSLIPLFALPSGLEVTAYSQQEGRLCVSLLSTQPSSHCPVCGTAATRIHSRYQRRLAELPSAGQSVRFQLSVRKFFCDESTCPRKIFTERLAPFVAPRAHMTTRLFEMLQIIGLATGGRLQQRAEVLSHMEASLLPFNRESKGSTFPLSAVGVRVTDRMGIQTTRHTLLRRIMALPTEPVGQVPQIGIDDFSFRRGRKFGTIIVDVQTHQVLDVLLDRTADTSAAWMAAHPEIELVSRDRGEDYASAAYAGAPQAIQCADRFHLLHNLGKALEGVLSRHLAAHRNRQTEQSRATPASIAQVREPPKLSSKKAELSQAKREEHLARYQQVVALHQLGFSQTAISSQVGIGHATVSRWLRSGTFPEQQPRPRKTSLDPHLPQLAQHWEAGCHTIAQLHRELVAEGYTHGYNSVYRQLVRSFPQRQKKPQVHDQLLRPPVLVRQAVYLFLRRPLELSADEQETLAQLRLLHPEVEQAYALVQQFAHMLRTRTGEQLDEWLCHARDSCIRGLQGFIAGVIRDKAAVTAGLTLPQNNGVVEGKVNKLKLIKRMGYGRAGFPLLRQRVLHAL